MPRPEQQKTLPAPATRHAAPALLSAAQIAALVRAGQQEQAIEAATAALAAKDLSERFERLVDTGLRLSEIKSASELHDFLIDEATELSGAERVLLVLESPEGLRLAGSLVPRGESEVALLQAVTPWLEEARVTRAVKLRHGPDGAEPIDQRSCLVAPLIAQRELLGYLYCDIEGAFGRFHDSDRDLLAMLAAQAAVSLANLRTQEGLERTVAERTAQLEQQAGELALINSIQHGMAAKLEFQAIVDLVGDKLRELFKTGDFVILWYDERTELVHSICFFERGQNLRLPPRKVKPEDVTAILMRGAMGELPAPVASDAPGTMTTSGTDASSSSVFVPIMAGSRLIGSIVLESAEREDTLGQAERHLLGTVAASMGVALENARLLEETQRNARESSALSDVGRDLSSTLDLATVMDRIVGHARDLLGAQSSAIFLPEPDGQHFRAIVALGEIADELEATVIEPGRGIIGSLLQSGQPEFINDTAADARVAQLAGIERRPDERLMVVPLKSGQQVQGAMAVWRAGGSPFDAREQAFLTGLSQQAVIALNNARLFDQAQAALQRQTASADILRVISQSPNDVHPVFEAIVQAGVHLFEGAAVAVSQPVGDQVHLRAIAEVDPARVARWHERFPVPLALEYMHGAALLEARVIDVPDVADESQPFAAGRHRFLGSGYRAMAVVPMLRDSVAVGAISVIRTVPGALDSTHLELLRTFADQAVIAIENVRLFNETKDALDRQTATAEVLQVISGSMADAQPVFERILDSCERLFGTQEMGICLARDGLIDFPAYRGKFADMIKAEYPRPLAGSVSERVMFTGQVEHIPDASADDMPEYVSRLVADYANFSLASAPMLWQGQGIGTIDIARSPPRPFSDKELALLRTFADQAVVAIQNAKLFNETKVALERQTATAEILSVIADSPEDVQPVLDAIVESAKRLIGGFSATVFRVFDGMVHLAAFTATDEAGAAALHANFPAPLSSFYGFEPLRSGRVIQVEDTETNPQVTGEWRELARQRHYRANVNVPMLREGVPIGMISVTRTEPGPFAPHHVDLLQSFAAQAVIATENVRLFNETKEALARQAASAEVLSTISESVSDTRPVFTTILSCCQRLIPDFDYVQVQLIDEQGLVQLVEHRFGQVRGAEPGGQDRRREELMAREASFYPRPLAGTSLEMALRDARSVTFVDALTDSNVPPATRVDAQRWGHSYSQVTVPLLWEGRGVGAIVVARRRTDGFLPKECSLLESFADQAVVALQNSRLFNETKEALERQTATSEILRVISESPSDVQPVLDAVAERARLLCKAEGGRVWLVEGDHLRGMTEYGPVFGDEQHDALLPLRTTSVAGRSVLERRSIHLTDVVPLIDSEYPDVRAMQAKYQHHAMLTMPLLREGEALGVISLLRKEARAFTEAEIKLLETFADQSVIAIENVRLFNETRESLERETATAAILKVISESPTDIQPVFRAIVDTALRLFDVAMAVLMRREGDGYRLMSLAKEGQPAGDPSAAVVPLDAGANFPSRVMLDRTMLHLPDWSAIELPPHEQRIYDEGGFRASLMLPIMRGSECIGTIGIVRKTAGAFSDKEISLMQSFVDQAVIAIENVRLFNETREALEQQTATAEILRVISGSVTDTQPVFEAIVRSCRRLFAGKAVALAMPKGDMIESVAYASDHPDDAADTILKPWPLDRGSGAGTCILDSRLVAVPDTDEGAKQFPRMPDLAVKLGYRSCLFVPLLREGSAIGCLTILRAATGAFDGQEVALAQTFADQAVIAIENVRLFNETKEALEQQTATVRSAAGHQRLDRRRAAGVRCHPRQPASGCLKRRPGRPEPGRMATIRSHWLRTTVRASWPCARSIRLRWTAAVGPAGASSRAGRSSSLTLTPPMTSQKV